MREYAAKMWNALKSPALVKIWQSSAGERGRILLLAAYNVLSALLSLGFTLVMKELVDTAVNGNRSGMIRCALLLVGVILAMLLSGYLRRVLYMKVQARLLESMRSEAMHRLLHKQFGSLTAFHSGELVNRIFSDVSVVAGGVINIVPPLLYLLIQLVGAAVILYRMNSGFMLILLVSGVVGALASFGFRHKMKKFHKDAQKAEDKFHARMQETLSSMRIIKASGTEERMEREAEQYQRAFTDAQIRRGRFSAWMGTGLGLIFRGSWLYALLWGCLGIYRGQLTYGTLTAILQLVGQIQSPFEGLISTLGSIYSTTSSAERLMELYDLPDETPQLQLEVPKDHFREMRLENLDFSYERGETVLKNVNLTVRAGDTMAIMGQSGCGKSTLFLLMLGIYEPGTGSIRMDLGEQVADRPVRSLFAYVPQGNALFSGTLRDNIAMFCKTTPKDEEIWRAAELACIDHFIRRQKQGLGTVIGEHGIGLSEGQAQRIAIARALMTDCPILLLDEATSALDEQTEAQLLKNIEGLSGRTCLIVTHRRAALDICNRIVKVNGDVTEGWEETVC